MPRYQAPTSDEARLTALEKARDIAKIDIAAGRKSITAGTLDAITGFILLFRPLYVALAAALGGRIKEVRERETARAILDTYVRDFWEVLKRRSHRLGHPVEIYTYYGIPGDGNVPDLHTFDDLLNAADKLITGETTALGKGFPAMSNPSIAALVPVLAEARKQAADVPLADRAYTTAQTAIAAKRAEADTHINDIMADLESSLRRIEPSTRRQILRSYGATFVPLPGEPADPTPGETPAANTPTAPV